MKNIIGLCIILCISIIMSHAPEIQAGHSGSRAWNIKLEIPNYDPLWKNIREHYRDYRNLKNLNKIIHYSLKLNEKYPKRAEPLLWLAWSYSQKSIRCECGKEEETKLKKDSISFAQKAYLIKKNPLSFRILFNSISIFKDINEVKHKHGKWIRESTPLPYARGIPDLKKYPEWSRAVKLWDKRLNLKNAFAAAEIFEEIAEKYPDDINALLWASRSIYYLGNYHSASGEIERAAGFFREGKLYAGKALNIDKYSIIANYWYALNLGRSVEDDNIFSQALVAKELLGHIIYCFRENVLYYYCGPVMVAGGAISKGGFITEKIMGMLGYHLDDVLTAMHLAEICYPNYLRITGSLAEIYYNIGEKEKAKNILKKLLKRNPDKNRLHAAENHMTLKVARELLSKIEKE